MRHVCVANVTDLLLAVDVVAVANSRATFHLLRELVVGLAVWFTQRDRHEGLVGAASLLVPLRRVVRPVPRLLDLVLAETINMLPLEAIVKLTSLITNYKTTVGCVVMFTQCICLRSVYVYVYVYAVYVVQHRRHLSLNIIIKKCVYLKFTDTHFCINMITEVLHSDILKVRGR